MKAGSRNENDVWKARMAVRYASTVRSNFKPKIRYDLKMYISTLRWYSMVNFTRYWHGT